MTGRERRAWLVVGSLFTTLFLVFGSGYNTAGVFFTPLLDHFGWTRAQLSLLQTTLALAAGLVVPLVGWLLDRLEARVSLVVANWFGARRGLALGLAMGGTSAGGMVMTLVASRAIEHGGWRDGYLALALPIFVIVIPLVAMTVRTRPAAGAGSTVAEAASALPGLEVSAALRVRSFWLIGLAQFSFAFAASGTNLHAIPYFMGIGYGAARAALLMSLVLGMAGAGKLGMGLLADRIGARRALVLNFVLCTGGMVSLLFAADAAAAAVFLVVYGLTVGAPLTLVPLVMADSLGLRRFGSLSGLLGLFNILGASAGPVVAGRIFDVTGGYAPAFEAFALALVLGAAVTAGCVPLGAAARQEPALVASRAEDVAGA